MFEKLKEYIRNIKENDDRGSAFRKLINYKIYHEKGNEIIKVVDINEKIETSIKDVLWEYDIFNSDYYGYNNKYRKNDTFNSRYELKQEVLCGLLYYLIEEFSFQGNTPHHKVYSFLNYTRDTIEGILKKFLKNMKGYHTKNERHEIKYKQNYGLSINKRQNYSNVDLSIINMNNIKTTEDSYFMKSNIDYIWECIGGLPFKQRYILKNNQIIGCKTQKQISEEFGVTQQAVSRTLVRAKNNLRDKLSERNIL